MSPSILAIVALSVAQAATPIQIGAGVSQPAEAPNPSVVLRAGRSWVQGEASLTYNLHRAPASLTQALTSISGEWVPEDRTHYQIKALADFGLPAQAQGWSGSPHLYAGAQLWRGQNTRVYPMAGSDPTNSVVAEPPFWRVSPLLGAGVSASYQRLTGRLTVHSTAAPHPWGEGIVLNHQAGVDLLVWL